MKQLTTLLHLCRWPNLVLTALTMYIPALFFGFSLDFKPENYLTLHLLVVATILVAAGGYIQNDIFDAATDAINRPDRPIPSGNIEPQTAKNYYLATTITGIACGFVVAFLLGIRATISPTLLAVVTLWWYARYGKKHPWISNLAIAIACSLPSLLVWQWLSHYTNVQKINFGSLFLLFGSSAFFLTWIREIIKDIQDLRGDRQAGFVTLPIKRGVTYARQIALRVSVGTLCTQIAIGQWLVFHEQIPAAIFLFAANIVPILYLIARLTQANLTIKNINNLEKMLKVLMALGVFTVLFWTQDVRL